MTVSTTANRIDYTGGAGLTYAYPFYIFASTDLAVYVNGVLKTLTTDYTVTGAGSLSGGNVVFVNSVNTLPVSIQRSVAATQTVDYVTNDPFPADTHEAALDRLTMICQQALEKVGRALKFKTSSTFKDVDVDDPVAGKFPQAKTPATSGIQWVDITASGSIGIPVSLAQGGTGATTAATALSALTSFGNLTYNVDLISAVNTSYLDVTAGTSGAITLTTHGGRVEVLAVIPVVATTQNAIFTISQDGVDGGQLLVVPAGLSEMNYTLLTVYSPAAGSHTYKLRIKVITGGSATMHVGSVANGSLTVKEVSA